MNKKLLSELQGLTGGTCSSVHMSADALLWRRKRLSALSAVLKSLGWPSTPPTRTSRESRRTTCNPQEWGDYSKRLPLYYCSVTAIDHISKSGKTWQLNEVWVLYSSENLFWKSDIFSLPPFLTHTRTHIHAYAATEYYYYYYYYASYAVKLPALLKTRQKEFPHNGRLFSRYQVSNWYYRV